MAILRDRKIGLPVALLWWLSLVVIAWRLESRLGLATERARCLAGQKTLAGAVEMYLLDQNQKPSTSRLLQMSGQAAQEALRAGRYIAAPQVCPSGRLLEIFVDHPCCFPDPCPEPEKCDTDFGPTCPVHGRLADLVAARDRDGDDEAWWPWRLVAYVGAWVVFPLAFWVAVLVRCYRWGRQYEVGRVTLVPASWILAVTAFFAPAGLLAMARWRQAVWQFLTIGVATLAWSWPVHLTALLALFWTAITRYLEERAQGQSPVARAWSCRTDAGR